MPSLSYKYKGSHYEEIHVIKHDVLSVGRLPSNDLSLKEPSVSRNHFIIKKESDGYYIHDNGSSNGTFLNDVKIIMPVRLKHNDRIAAGTVSIIFKEDELTTVKEINEQELEYVAKSPSILSSAYLNVIYSVARELIYPQENSVFYDMTIKMLCNAVKGEYGGILIIDEKTGELCLIASNKENGPGVAGISSSVIDRAVKNRAAVLVKNAGMDNRFLKDRTIYSMGISSALCAPIWEKDHTYGALYIDRRADPSAFSEEHLDLITIVSNLLALNIAHEKLINKLADEKSVSEQLKRFVPIEAVSNLLEVIKNNPSALWDVNEIDSATVMFADIVGFTALTEKTKPREIARILRSFFDKSTNIVLSNGGSINKFLGDGFMAVFGAPVSHPDDPDRAVRSAIELMKWIHNESSGIKLSLRIGIDTGRVVSIMVGSIKRLEYTVMGNSVNAASRLQAMAGINQVLVSSETNSHLRMSVNVKLVGDVSVRGKDKPLKVYRIIWE